MKKFVQKNIKIIDNLLIDLAVPKNINFIWCMGSMLGVTITFQIITGVLVSIHYSNDSNSSFRSLVNIHYNIEDGWILHNMHINGASLVFIIIYSHIIRNIFYSTYFQNSTWIIGNVVLIITIIIAFIGYVLPWGQISFWGATVITRLISRIPYLGSNLVIWIWGGYSVDYRTLNRIYSLHFLLPFILLLLIIIHLLFLHKKGSSNPLGISRISRKIKFFPFFTFKDLIGFVILALLLFTIIFFPTLFSDCDNFIISNPIVTPSHIQPEWYFLFAYTILRRVPNKLGGVIFILLSLVSLIAFPFFKKKWQSRLFNPYKKIIFFIILNLLVLTWIGIKIATYPFNLIGIISSILYFSMFILFIII